MIFETTVGTANIVNANATTVQIGGAASTLNLGAVSGTATINNPTIIGSQTTQSLWNTVATTVNFAGAASTLNIGAGNSTVNLRSNTIVGTASQTTVNLWNANATTVNFAGAANTINIGNTANANGITSIGHRLAVAGNATFSAYTTFTQTNEVVSASATLGTYDAAVASTFYHNSPTGGAFTASITNVPTTANRVMTIVIMIEQGGTPAYPSALSINGSSITPKWLSSTAPTGTASKTDIFSFSIIYVSSTWKVLGQYSTYG
jgi:hypothetical protein